MTNNEIVNAAINDPQAISLNGKQVAGAFVPSTPQELKSRAETELQAELMSLLCRTAIRRLALEQDYSLTLTGGDTSTDGRGALFTLPAYVGTVLSVVLGGDSRPLRKFSSRDDFDNWYYEEVGDSSDVPDCCVIWDRITGHRLRLMISSGVGSQTSATVHFIRTLETPVNVSILPDDIHHLVLAGLKRRLTGGQLFSEYEKDVRGVIRRLAPISGASSPMPLGRNDEAFNWKMSTAITGGDGSYWPYSSRRR